MNKIICALSAIIMMISGVSYADVVMYDDYVYKIGDKQIPINDAYIFVTVFLTIITTIFLIILFKKKIKGIPERIIIVIGAIIVVAHLSSIIKMGAGSQPPYGHPGGRRDLDPILDDCIEYVGTNKKYNEVIELLNTIKSNLSNYEDRQINIEGISDIESLNPSKLYNVEIIDWETTGHIKTLKISESN